MTRKEKIGSEVFTEDMQNKIQLTNKIGSSLIEESIKTIQDAQKKLLVGEVSSIMERLAVMQRLDEKTQRRLILLNSQLKAIESGEFILDTRYGIANRIKFKDESLNIDWNVTEQW